MQFIHDRPQEEIILLVVLDSIGSSPGRRGFKMAVTLHEMCGSIGGGIMEHKFVELAREKLREDEKSPLVRKQVHNKVAKKDQSGMICSGEQTIFLLRLSDDDRKHIRSALNAIVQDISGTFEVTENGITFSNQVPADDFYFRQENEDTFLFRERTGFKNELFIIGGGHCSLAFSKLMSTMDFRIHVIEDRPSINTFTDNSFAHSKYVVSDYSSIAPFVPSGMNTYVVIMTFGYRTDDLALRALIGNSYKYLGVLGSKNKVKKLIEEWKASGITQEKLDSIYSPIGLLINSQTPEEIAISIAAQIIQVKNKA